MEPWESNDLRTLVISDVHMDVDWAKAVFEKESGNYDNIVVAGDLLDSHREGEGGIASTAETAVFIRELIDQKYGPTTVLVGNHDLAYIEAHKYSVKFHKPYFLRNDCPGYTNSKSKTVAKYLGERGWKGVEVFKVVNGWLVSHAGFLPYFWRPELSEQENLAILYYESEKALREINFIESRLWEIGYSRGGKSDFPGPVWADWECDFVDELPIRQLVGHSSHEDLIRKIGRSYCIDGTQSTYAIIQPDGSINFGAIARSEAGWLHFNPNFRDDTEHVKTR